MSNHPAAFAELFGQLGQAMQNGAANARVNQDGASQPFEGAFTQLFGQIGQAMQNNAANVRDGRDGANHPFGFTGRTNQPTGQGTTRQASRDGDTAGARSGSEQNTAEFTNVLRGMATGVAQAFQNSSGFQEAFANVGSDISAGLEQAVQNMTSSQEFQEFQETMANMADAFGNEQPSRPSTSEATVQSLPKVQITEHDLQQEQNTSCSICLEQYNVGETAIRIPCGHLFHEACCKRWLASANTCPVCRFELPTDDAAHEQARSARMQTERRRPRLRLIDLSAKSVSELRHFADDLGIDCTGCVERIDLVNRIAASGEVDIIPESLEEQSTEEEHAEERHQTQSANNIDSLSLARLQRMSVREIKAEMTKLGVDQRGCVEKSDLIERLMLSGNFGTS